MDSDERKSGSDTYHISKLTETNYRTWAQQMRWILDEKDILGIVDGGTKLDDTATDDEQTQYERKVKKARSMIGAAVSDSVMIYIEGMDDPAEMWKVLEEKYNPKTKVTLRQTLREFNTVRRLDGFSMEQHLQRVQRLKRKVEEQGETVSPESYCGILLNSVADDEKYKTIVDILESQEDLKPAMIINRLMEEERKILGGVGSEESKTALLTSNRGKKGHGQGKPDGKSKLTLKCKHCEKKGHVEADCWTKYPEKRPEKSGSKSKGKKEEAKYAMTAMVRKADLGRSEPESAHWYLDSGASEHFSPFRELFETFKELDKPCEIMTAEGTTIYGTGIGKITVEAIADDKINILELNNVIYAPKMDANLLSTITLYDKDYEISMRRPQGMTIFKDGNLVANTVREGRLFRLKTVQMLNAEAKAAKTQQSIDVWHRRLGHLGETNVRKLVDLTDGMNVDLETTVGICGHCLEGKQTRRISDKPRTRATEPLELIHSDTTGQITPTSIGGANYAGTFTDDATGMTFIVPMKGKSAAELLERFKEFKEEVENQLGRKIKRLRTDGGGEYKKAFEKYLKQHGIIHETTAPYSPEQNGVSERANRTIMERVKAILAETGLPKNLWMELASTVIYLKNRSPTRSSLDGRMPYEAWHNKKPDVSHLRILGSVAYVHIPKKK